MSRRAVVAGGVTLVGAVAVIVVMTQGAVPGEPLARPWVAATVPSTPPDVADQPAALALLRRAATAARSVSYEGTTTVVAAGTTVARVLQVTHVPGRGTLVDVEGGPEGPAGEEFAPDAPGSGTLADATTYLELLARNHAVTTAGSSIVAGRLVDVVVATRAGGTLAARFWLDRDTGLLLRREVYDAAGLPAGRATFERLRFPAAATDGLPTAAPSEPAPAVQPAALERMRTEGWHCPAAVPAGMSLVQARETDDGAVHLVYSDGITTLSLFEQRGRLDETMPGYDRQAIDGATVYRRGGSPPQWVWQSDGSVFTLVADVPTVAVTRVVAALPPDGTTDDQGLSDRLGSGLGELGRRMGDALARSGR